MVDQFVLQRGDLVGQPRGRYLRGSRSRSLPMFVIRRRLSSVS